MKPATSRAAAFCCAALLTLSPTASAQDTSTTPERPSSLVESFPRAVIRPHPGPRPQTISVEDVVTGDGPVLHAGDTAVLQYIVADWTTGEVLGRVHGGPGAVQIRIDHPDVVPGWWQGMQGMRVGGRRALTLIPEMAAGPVGSPPTVYNNKTYYYIVDLLGVTPQTPPGPPPLTGGVTMPLITSDFFTPFG